MSIERFGWGNTGVDIEDDGEFVLFTDYEKLDAKLQELQRFLKEGAALAQGVLDANTELDAENTRLVDKINGIYEDMAGV